MQNSNIHIEKPFLNDSEHFLLYEQVVMLEQLNLPYNAGNKNELSLLNGATV